MRNLRAVARDFRGDMEIMRPFTAMVQVEELVTQLVIAKNGGKQPSPAAMQQLVQNIQVPRKFCLCVAFKSTFNTISDVHYLFVCIFIAHVE